MDEDNNVGCNVVFASTAMGVVLVFLIVAITVGAIIMSVISL